MSLSDVVGMKPVVFLLPQYLNQGTYRDYLQWEISISYYTSYENMWISEVKGLVGETLATRNKNMLIKTIV